MRQPLQTMRLFGILILGVCCTRAEAAPARYPVMAPLAQYSMPDRAAEIALARSAAPVEIARHAQVLVLGKHGYEKAVAGHDGFTCLVVRSWDLRFNDPEFWNPKIRSPQCFNAAAARSVLPRYLERTRWVLAGDSIANMRARSRTKRSARGSGKPAPGSMCYMMSEGGYLNDIVRGPWRPHVMIYVAGMPAAKWGANLAGSPVFADSTSYKPTTIFMVAVPRWSNGVSATGQTPGD